MVVIEFEKASKNMVKVDWKSMCLHNTKNRADEKKNGKLKASWINIREQNNQVWAEQHIWKKPEKRQNKQTNSTQTRDVMSKKIESSNKKQLKCLRDGKFKHRTQSDHKQLLRILGVD